MKKRLLTPLVFAATTTLLLAQALNVNTHRTIDGSYNNPLNPQWGAAHTRLRQVTPLTYADGISAPTGVNRPNPRTVSNNIFSQSGLFNDPTGLSDYTWVWGQFLDHDFGLTDDGPEPLFIQVPAGDPVFDPFGAGMAIIPMHRNVFDPTTGTDTGNPRQFINAITAFIDASGVYGSDQARADWLRTFEGGKLKVSAGNLMPYNTVTGEYGDPIDPAAPRMANATAISPYVFVAGDVRAGENPLLAAMHTIFVREHNRQCDRLASKYTDWTDEQLYQHARKYVSGFVQSIVYDEWLPALGVNLPAYTGYNPGVDPQVMNVFTAAAFRLGHTLLNGNLMRLDNDGNVVPQGHMSLRDAFFNPYAIQEVGGLDPFLKGMGVQVMQKFDHKVIDDVRNFLFGQPGFGGLDLVSININRGRERGLPDYNTVRASFGLSRYIFFPQINTDPNVYSRIQNTYANINNIDPWVGMLAERAIPGSVLGQTLNTILTQQFTALRDGDRFYYWNDPVLTDDEKAYIHNTTLRDIVMYNTGITLLQDNIFGALEHNQICDNMTISVKGLVRTPAGLPVPNVGLHLTATSGLTERNTVADGQYDFASMPFCELDLLLPNRNDAPLNGVSTFDIIQIQKHILGVQLLTTPYQLIAADINASGSVTTTDLIRLRKVILGIDPDFGDNTSWWFVLASFQFPEGQDPLTVEFPEWLDFRTMHASNYENGFIAVKVGDVNNSVHLGSAQPGTQPRTQALGMELVLDNTPLETGDEAWVTLQLPTPDDTRQGWQFELAFDGLQLLDVRTAWDAAAWHATDYTFRMSHTWADGQPRDNTISFRVKADRSTTTAEAISIGTRLTPEVYATSGEVRTIAIQPVMATQTARLGQNEPNPFRTTTRIPFELATDGRVSLSVTNAAGTIVFQKELDRVAGSHHWVLNTAELGGSKGLLYYRITTPNGTAVRPMIVE